MDAYSIITHTEKLKEGRVMWKIIRIAMMKSELLPDNEANWGFPRFAKPSVSGITYASLLPCLSSQEGFWPLTSVW